MAIARRYHCAARARLGLRYQFAPKHAELKANPGNGERRNVPECLQCLFVGMVGGIEVAKIGQQRPKGDEIFQPAGFVCNHLRRASSTLSRFDPHA